MTQALAHDHADDEIEDHDRGLVFDLHQLAAAAAKPDGLAGTLFLIAIGAVAVLIFYVMLVFAPRQVADKEGTPGTWTVRFLLFLVSLALGQTLSGLIHPA